MANNQNHHPSHKLTDGHTEHADTLSDHYENLPRSVGVDGGDHTSQLDESPPAYDTMYPCLVLQPTKQYPNMAVRQTKHIQPYTSQADTSKEGNENSLKRSNDTAKDSVKQDENKAKENIKVKNKKEGQDREPEKQLERRITLNSLTRETRDKLMVQTKGARAAIR